MDDPEDAAFIGWIATHWTPGPGDADAFLSTLHKTRRARRVRNDVLGGLALAAAVLLFVGSVPSAGPDHGWLASTSLADPLGLPLTADLAVLRSTFLATP